MKAILQKKSVGFYFVILAVLAAVISVIRFAVWAPGHKAMDGLILAGLIAGMAVDVIVLFRDNDFLMILATACYSVALFRLLTNSVGSFVDAFQGINMFGDATQVGTILSISAVMAVSALLSIIAGFLRRTAPDERGGSRHE